MTTIKRVAQHAGVSITSVSHAINHPNRVSDTMRRRVEKAIEELGYHPNPTAQNLRTGRTNLIALLIPDICNPFYPELVQVIQTQVSRVGLDTLIFNTDVPGNLSGTHMTEYLSQIGQNRFDGVIVASEALVGHEHVLEDLDLPAVYIGHLSEPIIDNVTIDDFAAAYMATEYLIKKGHQRIAHISGEPKFFAGKQRQQGYEKALLDHDLAVYPNYIYAGTFLRPAGREGIRVLLTQPAPPTAVFIANSQMAIGALATLSDMGKQVPEDIAIVTFDDIAEMEDIRPTLTTIDYSPRLIAHHAIQLLFERLEGTTPDPPRSIRVPFSLLKRNSA
ncbi:MAG: LacI family DNA-binding transcriptional regulator [Anaerolineae bacterium]|nr:LacI family DNA-binding transcriptional regulator [Anaerolineae bacterium]MCA9886716.1 LacI family DNA-binding transcriptional regulator [Anaerolineae bacterium]MCA9891341.1 LacI family DNA-binding transcriptional regulator [Anaerolineae bacterium]